MFKVHDNNEKPSFHELDNVIEQDNGKVVLVEIKKTIETKHSLPYSNCTENIHSETSHLVGKILQQNITYRQRNCHDLCLTKYIDNFSGSQKLTNDQAVNLSNDFDFKRSCSKLFPLECTSTSFGLILNEMNYPELLRINFYYSDRKYTEITQSVKVTGADFISNTGGVLGLFLELSFLSAYRFILFIFDLICV
jgi:hypothetical protein